LARTLLADDSDDGDDDENDNELEIKSKPSSDKVLSRLVCNIPGREISSGIAVRFISDGVGIVLFLLYFNKMK
jgi:hypothetical protein